LSAARWLKVAARLRLATRETGVGAAGELRD